MQRRAMTRDVHGADSQRELHALVALEPPLERLAGVEAPTAQLRGHTARAPAGQLERELALAGQRDPLLRELEARAHRLQATLVVPDHERLGQRHRDAPQLARALEDRE